MRSIRERAEELGGRAEIAGQMFMIDPSGYRYLEVRGNASVEPDDDYEFADRISAKYGGGLDLRTRLEIGGRRALADRSAACDRSPILRSCSTRSGRTC